LTSVFKGQASGSPSPSGLVRSSGTSTLTGQAGGSIALPGPTGFSSLIGFFDYKLVINLEPDKKHHSFYHVWPCEQFVLEMMRA